MTRPTPAEIEEALDWARRVEEISEAHGQSCHEYRFAARALLAVVVERDEARSWFEKLRAVAPTTAEVEAVLDDHDFERTGVCKGASDADE